MADRRAALRSTAGLGLHLYVADQPQPRVRVAVVLEALLTLAAVAVVSPMLYDAFSASFHELAARVEHGLAQAILSPLGPASRLGLLDPTWNRWQDLLLPAGIVACGAGVVTLIAGLLDPPVGTAPSLLRRVVAVPLQLGLGIPALLATLVVILVGLMLAPAVFALCLGTSLFGAVLGARRRRQLLDHEHSLSGLPPAMWATDHLLRFALVVIGFELLFLAAALGATDSDDLLRSVLLAIETRGLLGPALLGNGITMTVVILLVAAPMTRRTLGTLTWEPWVAGLGGLLALGGLMSADGGWFEIRIGAPMGFAAGLAGTLLAAAGMPAIPRLAANPVRSIGRLYPLIVAGLMALGYSLSTGFLGCGTVLQDTRIASLSTTSGAQAVAWADGAVESAAFIAIPEEHVVLRVGIPSSDTRVLDMDSLPLQSLRTTPAAIGEGPRAIGGIERVVPVGFGKAPTGKPLLTFATSRNTASGIAELDPDTGRVLAVAEVEGGCTPGPWSWSGALNLGLVACSDRAEFGLYEPSLGRFLTHTALSTGQPLTAGVVDPTSGSLVGLSGGNSPFLLRFDVETGRPRAWRFLGSSNVAIAIDPTGTVHVPRLLGRQVLSMNATELDPVLVGHAGFGSTAIAVSTRHARVLTASSVDGYLYASRPGEPAPAPRIRVGGGARSMALSSDESTLLVSGFCGVLAVDLERWLGK
ncbi:MAG: hypothetical protein KDA24_11205 [Deltaproteobacteria bacterium]|nr:hypothetical protein [Deltaproteobacteria bacterium]